MSHPDPLHDRENEYPFDEYSSGPKSKKPSSESEVDKLKRLIGESKQIRKGNLSGKKKNIAQKMKHKHDVGNNKKGRDEYDSRQDESNPFYK